MFNFNLIKLFYNDFDAFNEKMISYIKETILTKDEENN